MRITAPATNRKIGFKEMPSSVTMLSMLSKLLRTPDAPEINKNMAWVQRTALNLQHFCLVLGRFCLQVFQNILLTACHRTSRTFYTWGLTPLCTCSFRKISIPPPREEIFSKTPHTPLEIPIKLHTCLKFLGLTEPPTPQEIPIPSVGGVWIFSGCAHCHPNKEKK